MRHKTVETSPFRYTYRVYDRGAGEYIGWDIETLYDAYCVASARASKLGFWRYDSRPLFGTTLVKPPRLTVREVGRRYDQKYHNKPFFYDEGNFVIISDTGRIFTHEEIKAAIAENRKPFRYSWEGREERRDILERRLIAVRGSGLKIKTQYALHEDSGWDGTPRLRSYVGGYHRFPKTHPERVQNIAHVDEYGWWAVRGKRRKLPSSWDDRYCGMYDKRDCWKHHSKRRKQWIPLDKGESVL